MTVHWRPVTGDDLPGLQALLARVLVTDGGLPDRKSVV